MPHYVWFAYIYNFFSKRFISIKGRLAYLTSEPIALFCPHCNASISTRVKTSATLRTHTFAAMMLVFW